jgi:sugar/nucleoside kinase (ribokinase family)
MGAAEEPPQAVVAGHISLDLYPAIERPVALEPGRLVVVGPALVSTGGAVANVGVALHRLGVGVRLVARVGDDLFGRGVLDALAGHGAHLAGGVAVCAGETTSYTIVLSAPGVDRSFMHCAGANDTFAAGDIPYERIAGARILHFGYPPLMAGMYANGGAALRETFARIHDAGPATSLDLCELDPRSAGGRADWREVLAAALPHVDVFAPSIEELLFIFDRERHAELHAGAPLAAVVDHGALAGLADTVIGLGAAVAAIKLGDQGLYLRSAADGERIAAFCARVGLDAGAWRGREVLAPCFSPRAVIGTTGSGDATIAGLIAALLRGAGPAGAASAATAVGACSVEAVDPTSGIGPWPEIASRVASGWTRSALAIGLGSARRWERDAAGTLTAK